MAYCLIVATLVSPLLIALVVLFFIWYSALSVHPHGIDPSCPRAHPRSLLEEPALAMFGPAVAWVGAALLVAPAFLDAMDIGSKVCGALLTAAVALVALTLRCDCGVISCASLDTLLLCTAVPLLRRVLAIPFVSGCA